MTVESLKQQGKRVRDERERQDLTMDQLAAKSGVAKNTIARVETGETKPRGATRKAIAEALGWSSYDAPHAPTDVTTDLRLTRLAERVDGLSAKLDRVIDALGIGDVESE